VFKCDCAGNLKQHKFLHAPADEKQVRNAANLIRDKASQERREMRETSDEAQLRIETKSTRNRLRYQEMIANETQEHLDHRKAVNAACLKRKADEWWETEQARIRQRDDPNRLDHNEDDESGED
jgi:hypothetical protein